MGGGAGMWRQFQNPHHSLEEKKKGDLDWETHRKDEEVDACEVHCSYGEALWLGAEGNKVNVIFLTWVLGT